MNNKGFEFSFTWMFAVIVGAAIIIIAIFAASKLIKTSELETSSKAAASLGAIMNPVETSLESGAFYTIDLGTETRVLNNCVPNGTFGRQEIRISTRFVNSLAKPGAPFTAYNKYLFSESTMEGDKLYLFIKSLEMPYKVSDLMFSSSKTYCFVDVPREVEEDIDSLGINFIVLHDEIERCPRDSVSVCFSGTCNITVDIDSKTVTKQKKTLSYEGPLMYGAIFSDPSIYNCQVQRIIKRATELGYLYIDKSRILSASCGQNVQGELQEYVKTLNSANLERIFQASESIKDKNEALICKIF